MVQIPIIRHDHFIPNPQHPEILIRVREVSPSEAPKKSQALLFVHGAVIPSVLFDVPVPGYSWQEYFASHGYHTYALDMRGYGRSSKPKEMDKSMGESRFLCGHEEVLSDIFSIVNEITTRLQIDHVSLCGLSWGGLLSCKFTNLHAHLVKSLILLGPVYSIRNPAWSIFMDPENPTRVNPNIGGYRYLGEDALFFMWDSEIPHKDKSLWQDPRVREAILTEMLNADFDWAEKNAMKAFRSPNGVIKDIESVYNSNPLFDPSFIECPTLVLRGDHDKASLKEDMDNLFEKIGAPVKQYTTFGHMSHYALVEKRSKELMAAAHEFLKTHG